MDDRAGYGLLDLSYVGFHLLQHLRIMFTTFGTYRQVYPDEFLEPGWANGILFFDVSQVLQHTEAFIAGIVSSWFLF